MDNKCRNDCSRMFHQLWTCAHVKYNNQEWSKQLQDNYTNENNLQKINHMKS